MLWVVAVIKSNWLQYGEVQGAVSGRDMGGRCQMGPQQNVRLEIETVLLGAWSVHLAEGGIHQQFLGAIRRSPVEVVVVRWVEW